MARLVPLNRLNSPLCCPPRRFYGCELRGDQWRMLDAAVMVVMSCLCKQESHWVCEIWSSPWMDMCSFACHEYLSVIDPPLMSIMTAPSILSLKHSHRHWDLCEALSITTYNLLNLLTVIFPTNLLNINPSIPFPILTVPQCIQGSLKVAFAITWCVCVCVFF